MIGTIYREDSPQAAQFCISHIIKIDAGISQYTQTREIVFLRRYVYLYGRMLIAPKVYRSLLIGNVKKKMKNGWAYRIARIKPEIWNIS